MPLFTGGRIINTVRAADLLQSAAEHRLVRTREELVFNVSSTFYAILGQRKVIESLALSRKAMEEQARRAQALLDAQKAARVDLLRTGVRQAKESLRIEGLKYELGKGAIVDVLDAQSALLETQTSYYQTLVEFSTAAAQLRLAIGEKR